MFPVIYSDTKINNYVNNVAYGCPLNNSSLVLFCFLPNNKSGLYSNFKTELSDQLMN